MKKTEYSRRLDSNGRLVIPSRLRNELGITEGQSFDFYTCEMNGKLFLCIDCGEINEELKKAMEIAQKHGMKIVSAN